MIPVKGGAKELVATRDRFPYFLFPLNKTYCYQRLIRNNKTKKVGWERKKKLKVI